MEFVSFEDETGLYDATLFPNVYRRTCHLLETNQAYVVQGIVEEHFAAVTLTVTALRSAEVTGSCSRQKNRHRLVRS